MINETTEFGWTSFVFGSLVYERTVRLQKVTSQSGYTDDPLPKQN